MWVESKGIHLNIFLYQKYFILVLLLSSWCLVIKDCKVIDLIHTTQHWALKYTHIRSTQNPCSLTLYVCNDNEGKNHLRDKRSLLTKPPNSVIFVPQNTEGKKDFFRSKLEATAALKQFIVHQLGSIQIKTITDDFIEVLKKILRAWKLYLLLLNYTR